MINRENKKGLNTRCIHDGELKDDKFKGAVSPLYLSTAYDYLEVVDHKYPRYFNTPNQLALSKKISSAYMEASISTLFEKVNDNKLITQDHNFTFPLFSD